MSLSAPSFSSASTVVTETNNGSYDFKITGYSLNKGIGIGKCLSSETFTVGGYSWRIDFYPAGCRNYEEVTDGYVSIYVALINAWDVKAKYEIALLDQSGDAKRIRKSEPDTFIMSETWFLKSGEGSDVNFEVDGENFSAHRIILAARSPVFKAQFFGSMKDGNAHSIKIEDTKASIFEVLLHFIYWDALPDLEEFIEVNSKEEFTSMFQHLFAAADRYHIHRLSMICATKLYDGIAIDTAATTLALAEQHNCMPLKLACVKFIAFPQNFQAVRKTDAFKYLKESFPNVYMELLEYVAGTNEEPITQDKKGTEAV